MRLHAIPASPGRRHRKRKGIGDKQAGRGHKGQKARSGASQRPGFESGHVPLYRRLPQRGFNAARFTTIYETVNVYDFVRIEGDVIDRAALEKAGLVDNNKRPLKILGDGEVNRAVKVIADKVSKSARAKIEAAGGSVEETSAKPESESEG
ncbi:MAG: 50S ribosomal protein L15 [Verrucomicrobiota bacterium]